MAGLATGAFLGMLLQFWIITAQDNGLYPPGLGEALLAGLLFGALAALLVAFLSALHGRLRFWSLFPPILVVALLTGVLSGALAKWVMPTLVIVLLSPLIGYLIGLLFCLLCMRGNLWSANPRR
jgi:hypothetical protein